MGFTRRPAQKVVNHIRMARFYRDFKSVCIANDQALYAKHLSIAGAVTGEHRRVNIQWAGDFDNLIRIWSADSEKSQCITHQDDTDMDRSLLQPCEINQSVFLIQCGVQ